MKVDDTTILVPCRDAAADEMPTTAARLLRNANDAGWHTRATYAKAEVGDDGKVVESVLVRVRRWPLAAVGAWWNGKFELAYAWTAISGPVRIGARDLARLVKAAG